MKTRPNVQVVEDVLGDTKLSDIRAIVAGNPVNDEYAGTPAEVAVKDKLERALANVDGTFELVIHNSTGSQTAEEMLSNDLTILVRGVSILKY